MADQLIGKVIDRYRILDLIGEGGMARVYRAEDVNLERKVAIKILLPERVKDEKFLARFDREAKVLAQLSHPHIVKVMDYGQFDGMPYLVMEYIHGTTLGKQFELPMAWNQAFQILLPVIRALESAHRSKVVHRDIKPSNILINDMGQPMLTDFGIVKLLEDHGEQGLTHTGMGIGTPSYMAPEQSQGREVDARSDIYATGTVLFELITGVKPFVADTAVEVAMKHVSEPVPSPRKLVKSLPEPVEQIILKAMSKKPDDRFQSMQSLAQAMETALSTLNAAAPPPPKASASQPKARRKQGGLWAIGAVALAAISLTAYFVFIKPGLTATQPVSTATVTAGATQVVGIPDLATATGDAVFQALPATETPQVTPQVTDTPAPTRVPGQERILSVLNANKVTELNRLEKISTFSLAWSPAGEWIASGGSSGVSIINADSLKQEEILDTGGVIKSLSVSANGRYIAGLTQATISVWDAQTRAKFADYPLQGSPMNISFSPDGETLAVAMLDGKVLILKTATGEVTKTILGNYGGWSVAISPDGSKLSAGTSQGALLWELPAGTWLPVSSGQDDLIKSLVFSPDSKWLAAGSTNLIRIWKVETGTQTQNFALEYPGFGGNVNALAFSPDGTLLASGSEDFQIRLWDVESGKLLTTLKSHTSSVLGLTFSPDGKYFASGAYEGIIRLWGLP